MSYDLCIERVDSSLTCCKEAAKLVVEITEDIFMCGLLWVYFLFFTWHSAKIRCSQVQTAWSEETVIHTESVRSRPNQTCCDRSCPAHWSILPIFREPQWRNQSCVIAAAYGCSCVSAILHVLHPCILGCFDNCVKFYQKKAFGFPHHVGAYWSGKFGEVVTVMIQKKSFVVSYM